MACYRMEINQWHACSVSTVIIIYCITKLKTVNHLFCLERKVIYWMKGNQITLTITTKPKTKFASTNAKGYCYKKLVNIFLTPLQVKCLKITYFHEKNWLHFASIYGNVFIYAILRVIILEMCTFQTKTALKNALSANTLSLYNQD